MDRCPVTQVILDPDGDVFTFFESQDVVRHPLVQRIVQAYAAKEAQEDKELGARER